MRVPLSAKPLRTHQRTPCAPPPCALGSHLVVSRLSALTTPVPAAKTVVPTGIETSRAGLAWYPPEGIPHVAVTVNVPMKGTSSGVVEPGIALTAPDAPPTVIATTVARVSPVRASRRDTGAC